MKARCILPALALLVLTLAACARPVQDPVISSEAMFAVAPFTNPSQGWQVLAGVMPADAQFVDKPILLDLDAALGDILAKQTVKTYLPPGRVKDCLAKVPRDTSENRGSVRTYWAQIGKCAKADYLIVPQVLLMRERVGNAAGSDRPAKVILDLFVIDVKTGGLHRHFRFEEEQQALADNILDFKKFVNRGGKWVTAMDLAVEGMRRGVKEIGL